MDFFFEYRLVLELQKAQGSRFGTKPCKRSTFQKEKNRCLKVLEIFTRDFFWNIDLVSDFFGEDILSLGDFF